MRRRKFKLGTLIFRVVLHRVTRLVAVAAAVAWLYLRLAAEGYPWWLWAPACFLGGVTALWLWLLLAYTYQKLTYPRRAREYKELRAQLRREREGP